MDASRAAAAAAPRARPRPRACARSRALNGWTTGGGASAPGGAPEPSPAPRESSAAIARDSIASLEGVAVAWALMRPTRDARPPGVSERRGAGAREPRAGSIRGGDVHRVRGRAEAGDADDHRGAAETVLADEGDDGGALAERHAVTADPNRRDRDAVVARSASEPAATKMLRAS